MAQLTVSNLGNYGRNTGANLIRLGQQMASSFTPIDIEERRSDNTGAGAWKGEQREIFFFPINNLVGTEYTRQYSALFYAASMEGNLDALDCFTIYINIMRLASPAKEADFRGTLTSRGYTVCDMTVDQYRILLHSMGVPIRVLSHAQHQELLLTEDRVLELQEAERDNKNAVPETSDTLAADEDIIENFTLQALLGIYFNLITKKLTLQNINQWYKQRVKAYTKGAKSAESMPEFEKYKPIGFITNVAFDIAVFEGQVSLLNYKGTGTSSLTPAMSHTCRQIVSHFSGAITHSVAASRSEVFHSLNSNTMLSKLLNSPAQQEEEARAEDGGSSDHITAIAPLDVN